MKIKNIIFDFGGVLIDWNPRYLFREIFSDKDEMDFFLKEICSNEWNHKQDCGRSFDVAVTELVNKYPQYEYEIIQYDTGWSKMIKGEIEENVRLIKILKIKYRLFGLTNWSAEKFPNVYNQYPFFKELEGIIVSGEENIAKPDVRIFNLLLDRFELDASESLFIDDSSENITAAKIIGFQTIHLRKNVLLENRLKYFGVEL